MGAETLMAAQMGGMFGDMTNKALNPRAVDNSQYVNMLGQMYEKEKNRNWTFDVEDRWQKDKFQRQSQLQDDSQMFQGNQNQLYRDQNMDIFNKGEESKRKQLEMSNEEKMAEALRKMEDDKRRLIQALQMKAAELGIDPTRAQIPQGKEMQSQYWNKPFMQTMPRETIDDVPQLLSMIAGKPAPPPAVKPAERVSLIEKTFRLGIRNAPWLTSDENKIVGDRLDFFDKADKDAQLAKDKKIQGEGGNPFESIGVTKF